MDLEKIDKSILKSVIKEIIKEDSGLLKDVIKELLIENKVIINDEQNNRREKVEKLIESNFDKYDDVFKTLA